MNVSPFKVKDIPVFIRTQTLAFTLILPITGEISSQCAISIPIKQILLLILIAIEYHVFSYVTNDVIDLELDKTVPRRRDKPLVRGAISGNTALLIALLQIPLIIISLIGMGINTARLTIILIAITCMLIYNLFGKRLHFPMITDAIQGIAWGALLLLGAYSCSIGTYELNPSALIAAIYILFYIMITNGVFGSIRDLPTDLKFGVRSTAIYFGVKYKATELHLPPIFISYTLAIQFLLINFSIILLTLLGKISIWAWILTLLLNCTSLIVLILIPRAKADSLQIAKLAAIYLVSSLWAGVTPLFFIGNAWQKSLMICCFFIPIFSTRWFILALRGRLHLKNMIGVDPNDR